MLKNKFGHNPIKEICLLQFGLAKNGQIPEQPYAPERSENNGLEAHLLSTLQPQIRKPCNPSHIGTKRRKIQMLSSTNLSPNLCR